MTQSTRLISTAVATLLALSGLVAIAADTKMKVVEQAIETSAAQIVLPSGGVGALTLVPCAGCKPVTVLMGARTQLIVNNKPVSIELLRRTLAASPDAPAALFYRTGGNELTRLTVSPRIKLDGATS